MAAEKIKLILKPNVHDITINITVNEAPELTAKKLRDKRYYASHKDELAQYQKDYRASHREAIAQQKKEYRASHKEQITQYKKQCYGTNLDHKIANKIRGHKRADKQYNRPFAGGDYITIEWVKTQLDLCHNKCVLCGKDLKLTNYEAKDPDQFSIDRIDNALAHVKSNCQITCWQCNCDKK